MRYVLWLLRIVLFLLLLGFAAKNSDPVTVYYYFGAEWRAPMVFVLLICLCTGAAIGILATLGQLFRQRRVIADLKRELHAQAGTSVQTITPHVDAS
jgi:lipopolysaccharide assembly protein A